MCIYGAFIEKLHGKQPRKISIFDSAYNVQMWLLHKTRLCGQAKEVAKVRHELRNSKGKDLDRYEQAEM